MKEINQHGGVAEFKGEIDTTGTSLLGTIEVSYKDLKRIFGKEAANDGYKTDAEWEVMTPAGAATIYNYKDGKNYLGRAGLPKSRITEWHIGGSDVNVYAWVALAILAN